MARHGEAWLGKVRFGRYGKARSGAECSGLDRYGRVRLGR